MALNSGLFQGQDQNEQDMLHSPGWTIDEQQPGMFDDALMALPRGIGQAGGNVAATLAHGFQNTDSLLSFIGNPLGAAMNTVQALKHPDYTAPPPGVLADIENSTRAYAKTLTPDPRVAGSAANLIQGFGRSVTEFLGGTLAGGPEVGATVLGLSEGHARYHDLKDAGVDDQTARAGALIEGIAAGAGALLPMGLPGKWLASLSTAGELAAQTAAGAAINTTFGAASRYASATILENAGYPEMAKQQEPFDTGNMLADLVSGLFFGAHHGWGELNQAHVDPAFRDAAKVVQDRQAVAERAPGVPVDMRSMAVHRAALEQGIGDLLTGKSVDESAQPLEGAEFARRPQDEFSQDARALIADHFKDSGILEAADAHDTWLRGAHDELEPTTPVSAIDGRETPQDATALPVDVGAFDETNDAIQRHIRSEIEFNSREVETPEQKRNRLVAESADFARGNEVRDARRELADHEAALKQAKQDLEAVPEPVKAEDVKGDILARMEQEDKAIHGDSANDKNVVKLRERAASKEAADNAKAEQQKYSKNKADAQAAIEAAQDRAFRQREEVVRLEKAEQAFKDLKQHDAIFQGEATAALMQRPDLKIVDEHGQEKSALEEQAQATAEASQAYQEASTMFEAAVNCEARRGA